MPTHPRFRLRTLLLWVAFVAVVSWAIASPSIWWVFILRVSVLGFCGAGFALAWGSSGRSRVFWAATAITATLLAHNSASAYDDVVLSDVARSLREVMGHEVEPADPYASMQKELLGNKSTQTAAIINLSAIPIIALGVGFICRWVWERGRQEE